MQAHYSTQLCTIQSYFTSPWQTITIVGKENGDIESSVLLAMRKNPESSWPENVLYSNFNKLMY